MEPKKMPPGPKIDGWSYPYKPRPRFGTDRSFTIFGIERQSVSE
jgi:hypothetical protein